MHRGAFATVGALFAYLAALCAVLMVPGVQSAALTAKVEAHQDACFHAWVDQPFEKVGFYFAVQRGGDFDIGYRVISPNDKVIVEATSSSSEDLVFTANEYGEYTFCFVNSHVSAGEKIVRMRCVVNCSTDKQVDFDITVETEPRIDLPISKQELLSQQSTPVEESLSKLDSDVMAIERTLRFFRMRENHGFDTVITTKYVFCPVHVPGANRPLQKAYFDLQHPGRTARDRYLGRASVHCRGAL